MVLSRNGAAEKPANRGLIGAQPSGATDAWQESARPRAGLGGKRLRERVSDPAGLGAFDQSRKEAGADGGDLVVEIITGIVQPRTFALPQEQIAAGAFV